MSTVSAAENSATWIALESTVSMSSLTREDCCKSQKFRDPRDPPVKGRKGTRVNQSD